MSEQAFYMLAALRDDGGLLFWHGSAAPCQWSDSSHEAVRYAGRVSAAEQAQFLTDLRSKTGCEYPTVTLYELRTL